MIPVAAFTFVPALEIIAPTNLGVSAYHPAGIASVAFMIAGPGYSQKFTVMAEAMNPLTGQAEFFVRFDPTKLAAGSYIIAATATGKDGSTLTLAPASAWVNMPPPIAVECSPGPLDIPMGACADGGTLLLDPGNYTLGTCKSNQNTRWINVVCPNGTATIKANGNGTANPRINLLRFGHGIVWDEAAGALNFGGSMWLDGCEVVDSRPFTGPITPRSIVAAGGLYCTTVDYLGTLTGPGGAVLCLNTIVAQSALRGFAGCQTILGCEVIDLDGTLGKIVSPGLHPDTLIYGSPQKGVLVRGLKIRGRAAYMLFQPAGGAIVNSAFLALDVAMTADTGAVSQVQQKMSGVRIGGTIGQTIDFQQKLPGFEMTDVAFLPGTILPNKQNMTVPGVSFVGVIQQDVPPYVWPA